MDRLLHGVCTIFGGLLFILNDHENTPRVGGNAQEMYLKKNRERIITSLGYIINSISCCPWSIFRY